MLDGWIAQGSHKKLSFLRTHRFSKKLINSQEIYWQRKYSAGGSGFNPIYKGLKFTEVRYIRPNPLVIRIKYMGSVFVNHDIGLRIAQGMAIAGNVRSFIPYFNLAIQAINKLSGKNCT
jgi:hypothetical protein